MNSLFRPASSITLSIATRHGVKKKGSFPTLRKGVSWGIPRRERKKKRDEHERTKETGKVHLHLDRKNVSTTNLINCIGDHKKLLLYALCQAYKKGEKEFGGNKLDDLIQALCEKIITKEAGLHLREKLLYLSCLPSKGYAEKIALTKGDLKDGRRLPQGRRSGTVGCSKGRQNIHKNVIEWIDHKNVFNYYCTVLKKRKNNSLDDDEIDEDVTNFFLKKLNTPLVSTISMYLLNLAYLNSKVTIRTNSLYILITFMLKYVWHKTNRRISMVRLCKNIELLSSIMNAAKIKIEKNNRDREKNVDMVNKLKMMNKNEYPMDTSSFVNMCWEVVGTRGNAELASLLSNNLAYITGHFYHYFNIYEFECQREGCPAGESAYSEAVNIGEVDVGNEEEVPLGARTQPGELSNLSGAAEDKDVMTRQIVYMIYFANNALVCSLSKLIKNYKKGSSSERSSSERSSREGTSNEGTSNEGTSNEETSYEGTSCRGTSNGRLPPHMEGETIRIITNYMFNCLPYSIFCKTLFNKLEELLIRMGAQDKTLPKFSLTPSTLVQLMHLMSIQYNAVHVDDGVNSFLWNNLLTEMFTNDCKLLNKKDKILLYISISKNLFLKKKKSYLFKLNSILFPELVHFTYRDLYSLVYSISCSKFCDLPFFEALLRNIYKLRHKYSSQKLWTILSIFQPFDLNMSIFNMLLSYANCDGSEQKRKKKKKEKEEEELDDPFEQHNPNKDAKKLEEDLENKERILKELAAHIRENHSGESFSFSESGIFSSG
ncbi:hypothetical protein PCYB_146940 [Plasmodium cynomolgi strain B]|uniref:Uncharacterized protein n=1 Tax=Plasmodium cynomolgi (strain B) TaxID=1120755 RepID=K6UF06_PLACD|nr:hypothetical protein PCYB_146940 [Plasmodium cynomolgi strain B]GAB69266.1 hypothetical protein PCYB_146940 [Plasmodium cynomolgi strain B]